MCTVCLLRCQRAHWSAHRAACKQEPLNLWWRHLSGSTSQQLPSWAVVAAVGALAYMLMLVSLLTIIANLSADCNIAILA